jgi:hypothetical protein
MKLTAASSRRTAVYFPCRNPTAVDSTHRHATTVRGTAARSYPPLLFFSFISFHIPDVALLPTGQCRRPLLQTSAGGA